MVVVVEISAELKKVLGLVRPFSRKYPSLPGLVRRLLFYLFNHQSLFNMSLSVSELQRRIETMTSQQEIMFTFIEKGLAHLSKQLDTISKNNKINEEVIHHLQAVVRDSFDRINIQEQEIRELHEKQYQVGDCMLNLCQTIENKARRVKELEQELSGMREKQDTIALSNMWIYPAEPQSNHIMIPASPCLQPSLAPQWEFDPFYL